MTHAVLLLRCADRPGIVADVASWVATDGGTIVDAGQYSDVEHGLFLQRVEFEHPWDRDRLRDSFAHVAHRWSMTWELHFPGRRARLAVLTTQEAHCLYDLAGRCATGDLDAEISVVISNHPEHDDIARRFDTPFRYLPVATDDGATVDRDEDGRAAQESRVVDEIRNYAPDLIVLARYMRVLSESYTDEFGPRTINIHHSFLPAFAGPRPYQRAWERGVKLIGATAHYVTAELDQGPIIAQDVTRVSHADTPKTMARRGRDLESLVLATAVRAHLEHRVISYSGRTVVFE